jgi:hypothetical protein
LKVLFLVHNLGKVRHFERVIIALTERGHTVLLGAARKRRKPLKLPASLADNPRVDVMPFPVTRVDAWKDVVRPLRQARDYLRFLQPEYVRAAKLAERAASYAPPGFATQLERRPWLRRNLAWVNRGLALAETLVPSERYYELSILADKPDLILVTPLVDFGSYQTDYVKSAHRLGIPVAFVPFSWDNLTNRGLIRIPPDRVLVWNEHQKREAVELHGIPPERVIVTGAARFDDFFVMRPASTRDEFCASVGLDPHSSLLLYLCSSNFVAPDEVSYIRRWVRAIRTHRDERLRGAAILIRPHPANREPWERVVLDEPGTAIWNAQCEMQADQSLYDSLHHCGAVAGLNTSAMIEAAIVGRPVFTVKTEEFAGGQEQTLHFHYLLSDNGGLVEVAQSLEHHLDQLAAGLKDASAAASRNRGFVNSFVRPRGVEQPVVPLMVGDIEQVASIQKRPRRTSLWLWPARHALLGWLRRRAATHARRHRRKDERRGPHDPRAVYDNVRKQHE